MSVLTVKQDNIQDVLRAISKLVNKEVLVGIPESTDERNDNGPINNATIAYIQDNGSPVNNIPARPFMREGVEDSLPQSEAMLNKAAKAALDGLQNKSDQALEKAGIVASQSIKKRINSGDFVPLADSTLKARARRGRKGASAELLARSQGAEPGTELAKPLIDTGQMRNAITYVVRTKK